MAKGKVTRPFNAPQPARPPARDVELAFNRAVQFHQSGLLDEAEAAYREILARQPGHVESLHYLGVVALQRGSADAAVELIGRALANAPGNAAAHMNLGLALERLHRLEEALASYDRALTLSPRHVDTHINRGSALGKLNRGAEALAAFDRALELSPDQLQALYNRGDVLARLGRLPEALASYERALAQKPDYVAALHGRGVALHSLHRLEEALASYDRALALQPEYADALANRGLALKSLNRPAEALVSYDKALALRPDFADADGLVTRAYLLQQLNRPRETLASYSQALELRPRDSEARYRSGLVRLLLGDFASGWKEHEARWQETPGQQPAPDPARAGWRAQVRDFRQPRWRGHEPLAGKSIFVHAEQGLGDTIQFCRYVRLLADRGARVILEVQPALAPLLSCLAGAPQVISAGEIPPECDFYCPLLSLPLAFGTDLSSIPAEHHYLTADGDRIRAWRARLAPHTGSRVGLVWAGNYNAPLVSLRNRPIPLEALTRLALPGLQLVSVQKDLRAGDEEILAAHPEILHFGSEFQDFSDTAALVASLDLVISIDTSVAHLAGALGTPVWILLPFAADWRWLLDREDSPWYPSARLFRQARLGDWESVIDRVMHELRQRYA